MDELNLPAAGIQADSRGRIKVDCDFRTCQARIYSRRAMSSASPAPASVSMEQGRIAAGRAFQLPLKSNPAAYPYGIYTIPEISFIGKTEEQLTEEDVPFRRWESPSIARSPADRLAAILPEQAETDLSTARRAAPARRPHYR